MGRFSLPHVRKLVGFCQRTASRRALQCRTVPLPLGFCSVPFPLAAAATVPIKGGGVMKSQWVGRPDSQSQSPCCLSDVTRRAASRQPPLLSPFPPPFYPLNLLSPSFLSLSLFGFYFPTLFFLPFFCQMLLLNSAAEEQKGAGRFREGAAAAAGAGRAAPESQSLFGL